MAILKLLHDEIAPLVGVRLTTEEHLSRDGLSKRLRETLTLLLEGQSEKQVASALNLGTRTVHDYVTRLYEHFRVSSRAELLAYFIRRRPVPRVAVGRSWLMLRIRQPVGRHDLPVECRHAAAVGRLSGFLAGVSPHVTQDRCRAAQRAAP